MGRCSMPKIGFVSDHFYAPDDPSTKNVRGGAELTDACYIQKGKELGFDIDRVSSRSNEDLGRFNLLIISNHHHAAKPQRFLQHKYVSFWHDPIIEEVDPLLIKNAELNIFLSPLHMKFFKDRFDVGDTALQPSCFSNFDRFHSREKKDNMVVYIGQVAPFKGISNILAYAGEHPELDFHICGNLAGNFPFDKFGNVTYEGYVVSAIEWMSKAKYFVHLPKWIEAFGRTIVEALFCGCELIVNDRVGCFSYDWDWSSKESIKKNITKYRGRFWSNIEEIL